MAEAPGKRVRIPGVITCGALYDAGCFERAPGQPAGNPGFRTFLRLTGGFGRGSWIYPIAASLRTRTEAPCVIRARVSWTPPVGPRRSRFPTGASRIGASRITRASTSRLQAGTNLPDTSSLGQCALAGTWKIILTPFSPQRPEEQKLRHRPGHRRGGHRPDLLLPQPTRQLPAQSQRSRPRQPAGHPRKRHRLRSFVFSTECHAFRCSG